MGSSGLAIDDTEGLVQVFLEFCSSPTSSMKYHRAVSEVVLLDIVKSCNNLTKRLPVFFLGLTVRVDTINLEVKTIDAKEIRSSNDTFRTCVIINVLWSWFRVSREIGVFARAELYVIRGIFVLTQHIDFLSIEAGVD